jgi:nicotinate dehydrogenase subunit A
METEFRLTVNGAEYSVACEPDTPLLDVLRHDLGLAGPKFGCGTGLCGTCHVLIGDCARSSCDLPVSAVDGPVTTVEGLSAGDRLHPVQQAFIDEQAAQCGYCASGMVMAAVGPPRPSRRCGRLWTATCAAAGRTAGSSARC